MLLTRKPHTGNSNKRLSEFDLGNIILTFTTHYLVSSKVNVAELYF
jgi:hypothetical protein